jgi:malonyl-CoA O-methyltransferase
MPPASGTRGVFVTGTGTGIGKTVVSACLVHRWGAAYWKPVQTGIAEDTADSDTVAALAGAAGHHAPRHVFRAPLSPEAAAALEGAAVALTDFDLPATTRPLVVEGAGGVMVPLNAQCFMVDLMVRLALPVVLVASSGLGTINHTLLSLAALRARHLAVAGVVLVGEANPGNAEAIARHGQVRILHTLPTLAPLSAGTLREAAAAFPDFGAVAA